MFKKKEREKEEREEGKRDWGSEKIRGGINPIRKGNKVKGERHR